MEDRPRSSSLRVQILSRILIVGLVPLVILGSVAILGLKKLGSTAERSVAETRQLLVEDTATERVSAEAISTGRELDLATAERLSQVVALAREPGLAGGAGTPAGDAAAAALAAAMEARPEFVDFHITDSSGLIVGGTGTEIGGDLATSSVWQQAISNGIGIGQPVFHEPSAGYVIPMAARIDNGNGVGAGVLRASLSVAYVQAIADLHSEDGTEVTVFAPGPLRIADTASGHDPVRLGAINLDAENIPEGALAGLQGSTTSGDRVSGFAPATVGDPALSTLGVDGPQWNVLITQSTAGAPGPLALLEGLNDEIDDAGRELSFVVLIVVIFAGFIAAAVAAILTHRIVDPIVRLTERARHVADEGLPSAVAQTLRVTRNENTPILTTVEIEADNELGDLTKSFNSVQSTALRLAAEQALQRRNTLEMFANLGRRNQSLVKRQLRFIDALEQSEEDSERLASLFKLDHLATRMRRSAESLLIISGHRPPSPRTGPIRMELVVQGALGEVEHFERVDPCRLEPAGLVGYAVGDLAHIVAELVENALSFSPPDSRVIISGRAGALHYGLRIADHGMGMTEDVVAAANAQLLSGTDIHASPSRQLGLIVVSMLARRHDIGVRLMCLPSGGIEAQIEIPNELVQVTETPVPEPMLSELIPPANRVLHGAGRGGSNRPQPAPPEQRGAAESIEPTDPTDPLTWASDAEPEDPVIEPCPTSSPADAEAATESMGPASTDPGGNDPSRFLLSQPSSARLAPITRRPSRRPTKAALNPSPATKRQKRSVATTASIDDVVAEAEQVKQRWHRFQQGRHSAQVDDESKRDVDDRSPANGRE